MMNQKIFSSFLKMSLILGIMGITFVCAPAWAQSAFQKAYDALYLTFAQARSVVYVISGFGLICFAFAAIAGKFDWAWLTMIVVALFVLSMAEFVVKTSVEYGKGSGDNIPAPERFENIIDVDGLGYDGADVQKALQFLDGE